MNLEKVIRLCNGYVRETIHFNNKRMLMSVFFKDIFQQNFRVQKYVFMKCYCYKTVLFNDKASYFIIIVYIFIKSEEKYSLIWKAKPVTIHMTKKVRNDKTMNYFDVIIH